MTVNITFELHKLHSHKFRQMKLLFYNNGAYEYHKEPKQYSAEKWTLSYKNTTIHSTLIYLCNNPKKEDFYFFFVLNVAFNGTDYMYYVKW